MKIKKGAKWLREGMDLFKSRGPKQTHFPGLKPKRRSFRAKVKLEGDARGLGIVAGGIGAGALGVGGGVALARKNHGKKRRRKR